MSDPLVVFRSLVSTPADAVRWACLLEATSPKPGNVYPGRSFDNLCYSDFVRAAELAADHLGASGQRISERMLQTIQRTVSLSGTNVNLGIVLLLGPLVAADEKLRADADHPAGPEVWQRAIAAVLDDFDGTDGQRIYRMIGHSAAGGLGSVDSLDARTTRGPVNILDAMTLAKDYDRIARQYAEGFSDLVNNVVPLVADSIRQTGDVLSGVARAHVRLLAIEPDSLIARKNGPEIAASVCDEATQVDVEDPVSVARFDQWLRIDGHRLNPGTTADLIAGAIYLLLRIANPREERL